MIFSRFINAILRAHCLIIWLIAENRLLVELPALLGLDTDRTFREGDDQGSDSGTPYGPRHPEKASPPPAYRNPEYG